MPFLLSFVHTGRYLTQVIQLNVVVGRETAERYADKNVLSMSVNPGTWRSISPSVRPAKNIDK